MNKMMIQAEIAHSRVVHVFVHSAPPYETEVNEPRATIVTVMMMMMMMIILVMMVRYIQPRVGKKSFTHRYSNLP